MYSGQFGGGNVVSGLPDDVYCGTPNPYLHDRWYRKLKLARGALFSLI